MNDKILFVFPDAQHDYFEDLMEELEKKLQSNASLMIDARNNARAWDLITNSDGSQITLVVVYIELPEKRRAAPKPNAAILLENRLRKNEINTQMVIVVPKYDSEINQQLTTSVSFMMPSDDKLGDSIVNLIKKRKKLEKQLDIVLNLSDRNDALAWRYTIKCKNFQPEKGIYNGELKKMSPLDLENFIQFTDNVDNTSPDKSEKAVHLLRKNLSALLYEDFNQKANEFSNSLEMALRQVDNLEQTRVRFVVDEKVYPIFLEAIMSPKEGNENAESIDYWMQHAPLVRHVSNTRAIHPLFVKERTLPINVLIICSDINGPVELGMGKHKTQIVLDKLTNVETECAKLKQHLDELKCGGVNLGDIRLISTSTDNGCHLKYIQTVLAEKPDDQQRWDIVHYAGHSYYDENTDNAYFFFKDSDGYNKSVSIDKFAESLIRIRLLVLSSCVSAHKGFIFKLAKKYQIPAVIGFRTKIEDDIARKFSINFYSRLFDLRSVDRAFFQARKELFESENDDTHRAWTNPVLVLESVA